MDYDKGIEPRHTLRFCANVTGYSDASWRKFVSQGAVKAEYWGRSVRIADGELRRFMREGPRKVKAKQLVETTAE